MKWVNGLDSIRFVLAFIVFLSHMPNPFLALDATGSTGVFVFKLVSNHLYCGVGAVIAFFIISGFVIHFPNRHKDNFNVTSFYIRRILRISIPLVIAVIVAVNYKGIERIPMWSLYCELIYYIIYPLLFKLKGSWKLKFIIAFIASIVVIIAFGGDNFRSALHQRDINFLAEYWQWGVGLTALIGLPCWLLGVLLAEKIDQLNYDIKFSRLLLYRIGVYVLSIVLLSLRFHFFISYIFTLNFFALLLVKWIEKEIVYYKTHQHSRWLEYMGKFSYSLYLWHEMIAIFLSAYIPYTMLTYPLYLIIVVAFSYILYLLIEYPSHKIAQKISKLVATQASATG